MENKISVITEASDKYFHQTRVAVHSFIKHNPWFDGTLYLLTISALPISQKNLDSLFRIYENLQIINLSSLSQVSNIETEFKKKNRDLDLLYRYLRLFVLQTNIPNLLYFSSSSLFLGQVSEIISQKNLYSTNTELSLFYVREFKYKFNEIIENQIIKSEPIEKIFEQHALNYFYPFTNDYYGVAGQFNDSLFNKKKNQLSSLKYLNYNTFYSKFSNCSNINRVWLQENHELQKFLNNPSSIKKEIILHKIDPTKLKQIPTSQKRKNLNRSSSKIALCTICNDDFIKGAQTMIYSFLKNNKWFTQDIIIFYNSEYSNLSNENINKLSKLYKNIIFYKIETDDYLPLINKFNSSRNSKRFIPSLFTFEAFELAKKYNKILYLDSDMLVLQDIFELFMLNDELVVTPDTGKYDLSKKYKTFNGGFLLIDGRSASKEYKKKILLFSMGCKNMALADQSIMNDFFKNRVIYLDSRYNCLKRCFPDESFSLFDTNIKIIHYVGEKPWTNNKKDFEKKYSKIEYLWHSEYLELSNNLNNEYFNTDIIL